MARGWESKAVEAQIETGRSESENASHDRLSPGQIEVFRKKEGLLLSRSRVLNDLVTATNPRYRKILEDSLRYLDQELERLAC
jgi:hypothetical protein